MKKDEGFLRGGRLAYSLYRKPTAHRIPLGASSMHHVNTHKAWPMAEAKRVAWRSSSLTQFKAGIMDIWNDWKFSDVGVECSSLISNRHYLSKFSSKHAIEKPMTFWFVVPFTRGFESHRLNKFFLEYVEKWKRVLNPIYGNFCIKVCHKGYYNNLSMRLSMFDAWRG